MNFGDIARKPLHLLNIMLAALLLSMASAVVHAQTTSELDAVAENVADDSIPAAEAAEGSAEQTVTPDTGGFDYYGPDMIVGQPHSGKFGFQEQHTPNGDYALWMHDAILMPIITVISLFVLALLLWVIVRYNRRRNTVPSRTSHNTLIEILWTAIPVLILLVIAVPSITLLARQYKSPPEDAITVKANGYQWYWGYEYVDNGGFEVVSNMMDEAEALAQGYPPQLATDTRMVLPVGVPIRLQTFGKDVIHSFGVPSLWFKLDAVPGRINEKVLLIEKPGIYFGQCMELCGARHGYMPIMIEARPLDEFNAWVQTQPGGMTREQVAAQKAAEAAPAPEAGVEGDVSTQEPESAVEGAPGAGAAPTEDTAPATT